MPLERSFSFEENDEQTLSSNLDERVTYLPQPLSVSHQYIPPRDVVSPPPHYTSPPPREDTISPPSPTPTPRQYQNFDHQRQLSNVPPRRPVASRQSDRSPAPPPPPPHRTSPTRNDRYAEQNYYNRPDSLTSPGADHYSQYAQGAGLDSLARDIAERNHRESGMEATRGMHRSSPSRDYFQDESDYGTPVRPTNRYSNRSYASNAPLAAGAESPGFVTPTGSPEARGGRRGETPNYQRSHVPSPYGAYRDSPYHNSSHSLNNAVHTADINPHNIADDGDDGFIPDPKRRSMLEAMRTRSNEHFGPPLNNGRRTASGALGAIGGVFNRNPKGQTSSGSYDRVQGQGMSEKPSRSEWLSRQKQGNNRMKWIVGAAIITVVVLAVIAGAVGAAVSSKHSSKNASTDPNSNDNTASGDEQANGDLSKDSPQIKALLNNPDLHKVFPGVDYTPWGTQYPLCMTYPPSQNNVTRDMAILSQLTNAVRLYGTDCNQTEMVLHAIDRLGLDDMKVWLGVWVDTNSTTTDRQIQQMYDILESTPDTSIFKGVIIGNEALYRAGLDKAQSELQLISYLDDARQQFKSNGYNLPIATSDLGDNWNAQLVTAVDIVMSNIHPFFAGVSATAAASWTWSFWDTHDVVLTEGMTGKRQIISETGWPSEGGRDCGGTTGECYGAQLSSDNVAIASVDGMNTFMESWVCQALENGTEYFW